MDGEEAGNAVVGALPHGLSDGGAATVQNALVRTPNDVDRATGADVHDSPTVVAPDAPGGEQRHADGDRAVVSPDRVSSPTGIAAERGDAAKLVSDRKDRRDGGSPATSGDAERLVTETAYEALVRQAAEIEIQMLRAECDRKTSALEAAVAELRAEVARKDDELKAFKDILNSSPEEGDPSSSREMRLLQENSLRLKGELNIMRRKFEAMRAAETADQAKQAAKDTEIQRLLTELRSLRLDQQLLHERLQQTEVPSTALPPSKKETAFPQSGPSNRRLPASEKRGLVRKVEALPVSRGEPSNSGEEPASSRGTAGTPLGQTMTESKLLVLQREEIGRLRKLAGL